MVQTISIKKTVEVLETIEQEFPVFYKRTAGFDLLAFYSSKSGQRIFRLDMWRTITNNGCEYEGFINSSSIKDFEIITKDEYQEAVNEAIAVLTSIHSA